MFRTIANLYHVSIPSNGSSLFQWGNRKQNVWPRGNVSIPSNGSSLFQSVKLWPIIEEELDLVSIPSNGSSLFQFKHSEWPPDFPEQSQSPQTGQVYFNIAWRLRGGCKEARNCLNPLKRVKFISIFISGFHGIEKGRASQSPQTGQVYFNSTYI